MNLTTLYMSGRASLPLPEFMQRLTSFSPRVGEQRTGCLACIDFTIDPESYIFEFMARLKIPSVTERMLASLGAPGQGSTGLNEVIVLLDASRQRYLLRAQVEVGVGGEVGAPEYTMVGQVEFDGAGQVEFKPVAERPRLECDTSEDCLFGQACVAQPGATEKYCVGCAPQALEPPLKARYDVYFADEANAGDVVEVRLVGSEYECRDGSNSCDRNDPAEARLVREFDERVTVGQNGLRSDREMVRLLQEELRLISSAQCGEQCDRLYRNCARENCGVACFVEDSTLCVDCLADVGASCSTTGGDCHETCESGLPFRAWSNFRTAAPRVTIEANDLQVELDVITTINGEASCREVDAGLIDLESCPVVGVSERHYVNGQLGIAGGFSMPYLGKVEAGFRGDMVVDLHGEDNDPRFIGVNGELALSLMGMPVGNLGETTMEVGFNADDEVSYATITTNGGLGIGPGGSIRLGGSSTVLGYDHERYEFCTEAELHFPLSPVVMDTATRIVLPIDPETGERDAERCGIQSQFQLKPVRVPFLDALSDIIEETITVTGSGAVWCDGRFEFSGEFSVDPEFIPGFPLVGAMFMVNNAGVEITGTLELPFGLGSLDAIGTVRGDGSFLFEVSGELTVGGFELYNTRGTLSHAGLELHTVLQLPLELGTVETYGYIQPGVGFLFTGVRTLEFDGTTLREVRFEVRPSGVSMSSMLNIPYVTEVEVAGTIRADGYVHLTGAGELGIGDALVLGPVELEFLHHVNGGVLVSGAGAITVAGHKLRDVEFEFKPNGAFFASSTFDLWIAESVVEIERTEEGVITFASTAAVDFTIFEHRIKGSVSLSFRGGALRYELDASVSGWWVDESISLKLNSNGCASVSGLGNFCLSDI